MNPYDFVPINWDKSPERHPPSSHDRFSGVSGKIEGTITAETPIFIFHSPKRNNGAEPFIKNKQNQHIIPGSSLKGLFRNLVETVGNGCFLLFDGNYKKYDRDDKRTLNYHPKLPDEFKKCESANCLCIACRMFGMTQGSDQESNFLLLGKVSFNDAVEIKICAHPAIYTIPLLEPKPRHRAFYLSQSQQRIAGRKFYFHQPSGIQVEHKKSNYNQHIKPIDKGSQFAFSVQFTNLEPVELQTLLYALDLEPEMRHKLGYGKPVGLGSVHFDIKKLTLIDYSSRYTTNQKTVYASEKLKTYLSTETLQFTTDKKSSTLNALRRIWRWNPSNKTAYRYPRRSWFNKNRGKRISGTP